MSINILVTLDGSLFVFQFWKWAPKYNDSIKGSQSAFAVIHFFFIGAQHGAHACKFLEKIFLI